MKARLKKYAPYLLVLLAGLLLGWFVCKRAHHAERAELGRMMYRCAMCFLCSDGEAQACSELGWPNYCAERLPTPSADSRRDL